MGVLVVVVAAAVVVVIGEKGEGAPFKCARAATGLRQVGTQQVHYIRLLAQVHPHYLTP